MWRYRLLAVAALCLAGLTVSACSRTDTSEMTEEVRVAFRSPQEGDEVSNPVAVCLEIHGLEIAPAGSTEKGTGHHHILIDPSDEEAQAIMDGVAEAIPVDDTHIHWDDGSACGGILVPPGNHLLMAVVADGEHVPLKPPVTDEILISLK